MSKVKQAAAVVLTAGLLAGGALTASPAYAGSDECKTNEFCLWQDANYNGLILHRMGVDASWYHFPSSINDKATSAANLRGSLDSAAARNANGGGGAFCFNGNTWTDNANFFGSWNDTFSSSKNYGSSAIC